MDRRIRNRLRMLNATLAHLDEHPDAWSTQPPLVRAVAAVRDGRDRIADAGKRQAAGDTRGHTEDRADALDAAADALADLSRRVTAYAVETGDDALRQAVDRSRTEWHNLPEAALVAESADAIDRTRAVLPALAEYGVTEDTLTLVEAAVARVPALSERRDNVAADRTDATADLGAFYSNDVVPALDTLDRLVPALIADPDVVDQYRLVRRIPGD